MANEPFVLPQRQQSELIDNQLAERLNVLLPEAMRAADLDMWLIICQEDNPDPVFSTMIPVNCWSPILNILAFHDRGPDGGIERFDISRTGTGDLYAKPWDGSRSEEQWALLRELIEARDPKRIGVNTGQTQWAAGGLSHGLYEQLLEALPERYRPRLVSAEKAATVWCGKLTDGELQVYPTVVGLAEQLLEECYSGACIEPGKTRTEDIEWHYRQRCADLGIEVSFKPYFFLFRRGDRTEKSGSTDTLLRPGDFLRCDVGLRYLRLCTDHQRWAFVASDDEPEPPAGMKRLMQEANRLQDIFMAEFRTGLSGNELLAGILARARDEGIPKPRVYSHSLGLFLHQTGPLVGLPWEQECCPGRGDVKLQSGNCFAMELSVTGTVPEWGGQEVTFALEEPVAFTGQGCRLIGNRQTEFYVPRAP